MHGCLLSCRSYESTGVYVDDSTQYWQVELTESIKKIRRDFEMFYSTIYQETAAYYETKMEELDKEAEQAVIYQRKEMEELVVVQQTLQVEYEKVQYTLTSERDAYAKLELTYCKDPSFAVRFCGGGGVRFCSELGGRVQDIGRATGRTVGSASERSGKSAGADHGHGLRRQRDPAQVRLFASVKGRGKRTVRCSKVSLEAEIIIYRYLLDNCGYGSGERVTVVPQKQIMSTVSTEMSGKFVAKGRKKRAVGISTYPAQLHR